MIFYWTSAFDDYFYLNSYAYLKIDTSTLAIYSLLFNSWFLTFICHWFLKMNVFFKVISITFIIIYFYNNVFIAQLNWVLYLSFCSVFYYIQNQRNRQLFFWPEVCFIKAALMIEAKIPVFQSCTLFRIDSKYYENH